MAIENSRPIVIDLTFDPGWAALRTKFEGKATDFGKTPPYVQRIMARDPERLEASSTAKLLQLVSEIKDHDENALATRCYVYLDRDIRPFSTFFLAHDEQKIIRLKNSFHTAAVRRSDLSLKERTEFLDSLNGYRRASAFPRLLYFRPSENTRTDEREGLPLLFDASVNCGPGKGDGSGDLIISPVVKAHNVETRAKIKDSRQVAIVAVPRINLGDFIRAESAIREDSDPVNQFAQIVFGVINPKQVATRIPGNLLAP